MIFFCIARAPAETATRVSGSLSPWTSRAIDLLVPLQIEGVSRDLVDVSGDSAEHLAPERSRLLERRRERRGRVAQQPHIGHGDGVDCGALLGEDRFGAEDATLSEPGQRRTAGLALPDRELHDAFDHDVEILLLLAAANHDLARAERNLLAGGTKKSDGGGPEENGCSGTQSGVVRLVRLCRSW